MPWKVLIADDDPNVREIIRLYFRQQQIELVEAPDGASALSMLAEAKPDIVILDVMMPGLDGFETCREIMKRCEIPVIMLTAKNDEIDRVLGLELGADDYMTKPFSPRELVARIKAIFRRMQKGQAAIEADSPAQYEFDDLVIHVPRREVNVGSEKIDLRPKEFELLAFFAKSPGSVFTREQLLQQVWGYEFSGDMRTVDVHVKKLREKLSPCPHACIHTVWGVGYKFEVEACT
ncbi:DNA-binding response regulator [Xylanibacillus composti]|uniref:DNA-binding response regulator n=1 Tax=Xylanibacillus composti TaxID=1572762 RepID=A0A8J4M4H4_9BACL|nr:response regulator transcription factor [Xylanibacillus composti]MDT9726846.1 DNA-binding response regulator [Xylanibacillus composti]GIQ70641.1 DNA-binding response regulator [Xylanibacillus composti]